MSQSALSDANQRKLQALMGRGLSIETVRVGTMAVWAGTGVPDGYLQCNGAAVSRATYTELFRVIGTRFGVGDGATTFNLPNAAGPVANTVWVIRA